MVGLYGMAYKYTYGIKFMMWFTFNMMAYTL